MGRSGELKMDLFANLTPEEKLTKARVKLNKHNPFFAFLVMKLRFIEKKDIPTIGVDKYGNCVYNPDYIAKETDEAIISDLAHETLHCALEHLIRVGNRNKEIWNIVTDSLINSLLLKDGFKGIDDTWILAKDIPKPDGSPYTTDEIIKKTAEELYDSVPKKEIKIMLGSGSGNGNGNGKQFDIHIFDDQYKNQSGMTQAEIKSKNDGRYWKRALTEAYTYSKMMGKTPMGIERQLEKLLDNTIDWKSKLYKYITNLIPIDYTWRHPHRKSYSLKTYLPAVSKEKLDVIVDLDSSGSISQKQLTEFLSEVVGILEQFNNVELTMLSNDTEVYNPKTIQNPTIRDVANYKVKGCGGTNHKPVFEWIRKNKPTSQLLIAFTDGYTTYPKPSEVNINTIWVLSKGNKQNIPFGEIVELKRSD